MLYIPYYLHGNWKLDTNELQSLEQNLLNGKQDGVYTTFAEDNKHLGFLKSFYQNIVDEIAKQQTFYTTSKIEYKFWVQMYNNKACHESHTHFGIDSNVIISWVHFLKVPETKCFRFTDGINHLVPQQEEGDLLVFPPYCRHEVMPHNSNMNRIVVAGNINLFEHKSEYF